MASAASGRPDGTPKSWGSTLFGLTTDTGKNCRPRSRARGCHLELSREGGRSEHLLEEARRRYVCVFGLNLQASDLRCAKGQKRSTIRSSEGVLGFGDVVLRDYWILRVAPQKPRAPEAQQGICLEMSIKIYEKAFFKGPSGVCKGFKEGLDNHYSEE